MNALFASGWTQLEIAPRRDSAGPDADHERIAVDSVDQARHYLNRYAAAPSAMARLRALAAGRNTDVPRQSDDEVLQWMARALRDGAFQLRETRLTPPPGRAPDAADTPAAPAPPQRAAVREQPAPLPPARAQAVPAAAPPPAAANELDSVDHDAQAATLVAAARDGTPFCAVCERERQRRLAAA